MSWPAGIQRFDLTSTDSTMKEARRRASSTAGDFWVHALTQTAGTGRRGRAWDTGAGNFSASLLMRPGGPPAQLALRSFVASLALHETLVALTGREAIFALKWPNDVLLRGGKLAGILLETHGSDLIVGIGVNLRALPPSDSLDPGAVPPRTLYAETGIAVGPGAFLDVLAPAFASWEERFQSYGFSILREAWLQRAARVGETITARLPGEEVQGRFETLDDEGQLVLMTGRGRRTIAAGEVFF